MDRVRHVIFSRPGAVARSLLLRSFHVYSSSEYSRFVIEAVADCDFFVWCLNVLVSKCTPTIFVGRYRRRMI